MGNKMTAKNRITINLDDGEYKALQEISEQIDRSLSWLGRKAVYEFINKSDVKALTAHDAKNTSQQMPAQ